MSQTSWWSPLVELIPAFVLAGLGNIAASYWFANVTQWKVFQHIPQLIILVTPLLGLKGNVEMTLASRLSTHANMGELTNPLSRDKIIIGNMALVQCQASTVGLIAPLIAISLSYLVNENRGFEPNQILLLCSSSVITANIANLILSSLMCLLILLSLRFEINPDNIATPIAASLGDFTTMLLLASVSEFFHDSFGLILWFQVTLMVTLLALIPYWIYIARNNQFTSEVVVSGWYPICGAMLIQNSGGLVMEKALNVFPRIASLQLIINGVGGNLVSIQASTMSTFLHKFSVPKVLPDSDENYCQYPFAIFFSTKSAHSNMARLLLFISIPSHFVFLLVAQLVNRTYYLTSEFILIYLAVGFLQVVFLLQIAQTFINWLWSLGYDPDNNAIPFLTAFADLLGAALLAFAFYILYYIGDKNATSKLQSNSQSILH